MEVVNDAPPSWRSKLSDFVYEATLDWPEAERRALYHLITMAIAESERLAVAEAACCRG